eukprot:11192767-Lingulodinium_polyedra.AAC.1
MSHEPGNARVTGRSTTQRTLRTWAKHANIPERANTTTTANPHLAPNAVDLNCARVALVV